MSQWFVPIPPWTALCRFQRQQVLISVTEPDGLEVLKARLPVSSPHSRALLELLESLARYSGHRLDAVMSAAAGSQNCFEDNCYGDEVVLGPSAMVHVVMVAPRCQQLRLALDPRR